MGSDHGNSNQNMEDHHLYEIVDNKKNEIYKYGISGRKLNPDGSSPRANEQIKEFNNLAGWIRYIVNILLTKIPGRIEAKCIEADYIENYKKKYGHKPKGNR